jgi:hypothetical protein
MNVICDSDMSANAILRCGSRRYEIWVVEGLVIVERSRDDSVDLDHARKVKDLHAENEDLRLELVLLVVFCARDSDCQESRYIVHCASIRLIQKLQNSN